MTDEIKTKVADAIPNSWVHQLLPGWLWPYAQLARWERPIGWWLLMWPCWWSFALASQPFWQNLSDRPVYEVAAHYAYVLLLFMAGAIVMRGAGCTYNDLVDKDIDDQVARTRSRPLPSGRVTKKQAFVFLCLQLLAGLIILLQFEWFTIQLGVLSLVTVVIYPFMKKITWWPQLFLGFAFSWGALMGWTVPNQSLNWPAIILYIGCIAWVIGYDTIYAHQDKEDDALVGVKSTARLFGDRSKPAISMLYGATLILFTVACLAAEMRWPAFVGIAIGATHMFWQIRVLDIDNGDQCLKLFKSNTQFGWIIFVGFAAASLVS